MLKQIKQLLWHLIVIFVTGLYKPFILKEGLIELQKQHFEKVVH